MKKAFKIAGAIAGAAALIGLTPYSFNKGQGGRLSVYALLWNSTVEPDPDDPAKRKITIDIGFHNPLQDGGDELECQWVSGDEPSGDGITLTLEPDLSDLPGDPAPETPDPAAPQA